MRCLSLQTIKSCTLQGANNRDREAVLKVGTNLLEFERLVGSGVLICMEILPLMSVERPKRSDCAEIDGVYPAISSWFALFLDLVGVFPSI